MLLVMRHTDDSWSLLSSNGVVLVSRETMTVVEQVKGHLEGTEPEYWPSECAEVAAVLTGSEQL